MNKSVGEAAEGSHGSPAEDRAYDEYLELLLSGAAPPPREFLSDLPAASEELRAALQKLFGRQGRALDPERLPFERLGEYRIVRRLGQGGMGIVFLAEQTSLGRLVALKVIRPELIGSGVASERFRREARALARLRHPNIVAVYGGGEEAGVRYLAMELVAGSSLSELIKRGEIERVPVARKVRWFVHLARALEAAHAHGIVHRDVKPSNIRISSDARCCSISAWRARATARTPP